MAAYESEVAEAIKHLGDAIMTHARVTAILAAGAHSDSDYRQREMGIEAAYQLANQTMAVNMMDGCAQEGFTAFTEKRKPSWSK